MICKIEISNRIYLILQIKNILEYNIRMITYTRYLYNFDDVTKSFIISVLNKDLEQSYFWAFEMYYSGFTDNIFKTCLFLYKNTYVFRKALNEKFEFEYQQWKLNDDPIHLATIIKNLINQNISITRFIKTFLKYKKVKDEPRKAPSMKFLYASRGEITEYENVSFISGHNYRLLKFNAKYQVRREFDELFKPSNNSVDELCENWLYHASHSPIWLKRIHSCNGEVNHETKQVNFASSLYEDDFHNSYDFEPDEQSLDVQNTLVGNNACNKLDLYYLCKFYGGVLG